MKSMYKDLCKGLAVAVLVFGIIGSIVLAATYGEVREVTRSLSVRTERSVLLTLAIFVSGIFSTGILFVILEGLGEALEYLEILSKKEYGSAADSFQNSELPPL